MLELWSFPSSSRASRGVGLWLGEEVAGRECLRWEQA